MTRLAALAAALGLAACASPPPAVPPADLLASREGAPAAAQERRFEGVSAQALAQAALQVLQDSSFIVKATEPELGLIIAARGESAKSPDELTLEVLRVIARIHWDVLTLRIKPPEAYAPPGTPNVVVLVTPTASGSSARVTFHSVGSTGTIRVRELADPKLQQKFFALLAQALASPGK